MVESPIWVMVLASAGASRIDNAPTGDFRELPMEAVQFHPESILTLEGDCGLKLMANVVARAGRLCRASP